MIVTLRRLGLPLRLARALVDAKLPLAPALDWSAFPPGGPLTDGTNCYSYAMGVPTQRLMPGWLAAARGDARAESGGENPRMRRRMFCLDGLDPLRRTDLSSLPPGAWVVSLHQRRDNDFHLRRLDRSGWSEKRGDHAVQRFVPKSAGDLLRASAEDGPYYFSGFFVVDPGQAARAS